MARKVWATLAVVAILATACSDDGKSSSDAKDGGGASTTSGDARDTALGDLVISPGVEHLTVAGAEPGSELTLVDAEDEPLLTLVADEFGQVAFSYIPDELMTLETGPGAEIPTNQGASLKAGEYTIRDDSTDPPTSSEPFKVLDRDDIPDESLYEGQELDGVHVGIAGVAEGEDIQDGFGYIEMRDGVKLSAMVRFPDPVFYGDGPYPTVVEYSGYSPSNPGGPDPGSRIANLLGFATVGVNMRGSGCSGGVFDVFNPAQQADGYDIVETVARQPWVLHNEVGMIGLSYSGISQLYAASTQPPSLAAVTPLSVIEDPWRQQWPGGIYNAGFTKQWLAERDRASSATGSPWVADQIDGGDEICESHLNLRNQNVDFEQLGRALEFYAEDAKDRRLGLLVRDIEVPVYLTGAWQDEQTGGRFGTMLDDFTGTDIKKFTLFNGRHPDGYTPMVLTRWYEFLSLYVAKRVPRLNPVVRQASVAVFEQEFKVPGLEFEPDRFADFADDEYEEALEWYESEPTVRVLFESGAGRADVPGAPVPRFEATFDSWPPSNAEARRWYLGPEESLTDEPPTEDGVDAYEHDPEAGALTYSTTGAYDFLYPLIEFDWPSDPDGFGLSYLTAPLEDDLVVAGSGHVDLWVTSDAEDAVVEVLITEVQPNGTEFFVQNGVLRLGHRTIDEEMSDELNIEQTYAQDDFSPLTPGEMIEAKVPILPVAHAFRAGSRLRLTINTPGRDLPLWAFENPDYGTERVFNSVARSSDMPSFLVLPVVEGVEVVPGYPPCPSLRGQVCRPFVASVNPTAD